MGFVLNGFGEYLRDNLGGRFDVVGFDPRGIGASDPLHCFDSEEDLVSFLSAVPLFPYERTQYLPFYNHFASLAGRCLSRGEVIAAHMSTADVARDLDLLRRAVGDRRLTYLGFSYGTYIGTTYANLFPRNIRALVIDGVLDPSLWSSGWQIRSDRVATQEEFDEFLRLCREAGPACAFGAGRHTAKRWETLARSVERKPIDLGDGFLYTYDFLIGDATGAMYAPEIWGGPEGYGVFLDLLADAALGDQSARQLARTARRQFVQRLEALREADYPNGFDGYYGNQCADTEYPGSFAGVPRSSTRMRGQDRGSARTGGGSTTAAPTGRSRKIATSAHGRPARRRPSSSSATTSTASPPTPGRARSTSRLANSRLLSYAGWGHTAYGRSDCTTAHVDAYLVDGTLPRPGTVCPANPNPFLSPPTALERQPPHRRSPAELAAPPRAVDIPWPPRPGRAAAAARGADRRRLDDESAHGRIGRQGSARSTRMDPIDARAGQNNKTVTLTPRTRRCDRRVSRAADDRNGRPTEALCGSTGSTRC